MYGMSKSSMAIGICPIELFHRALNIYRIICPTTSTLSWGPRLLSHIWKKVTARPPQLYQRLGGGALSPEGIISIFVTSWDTVLMTTITYTTPSCCLSPLTPCIQIKTFYCTGWARDSHRTQNIWTWNQACTGGPPLMNPVPLGKESEYFY